MNAPATEDFLTSLEPRLETSNASRKLLVFAVGKLYLALPVESVQKVLPYTALAGSGTTATGIVHLEEHDITAIDLYKRLFKTPPPNTEQNAFLILAKNSIDELFGIAIGQTPSLIDVLLSQIRVLPDSYRRTDTLEIATHVTRLQQQERSLTVFVLDTDQLVPPM